MERDRRKYNVSKILSALLLIMALLWLTISLPFVYSSQQELAKQNKAINDGSSRCNSEEEAASCFGNTTEEKAPQAVVPFLKNTSTIIIFRNISCL